MRASLARDVAGIEPQLRIVASTRFLAVSKSLSTSASIGASACSQARRCAACAATRAYRSTDPPGRSPIDRSLLRARHAWRRPPPRPVSARLAPLTLRSADGTLSAKTRGPGPPTPCPTASSGTASSRSSSRAAWRRCSAPRARGSRASTSRSRSSASCRTCRRRRSSSRCSWTRRASPRSSRTRTASRSSTSASATTRTSSSWSSSTGRTSRRSSSTSRRTGSDFPVEAAVFIALEICKGLTYAHELTRPRTASPLHIVHRDMSPPNVLITKYGEVKIVDFGLAKAN